MKLAFRIMTIFSQDLSIVYRFLSKKTDDGAY